MRVPGGNFLYVSANGGASWRRALPGLVGDDVESDAVTPGVLVVEGAVPRRSTNFGRTFIARPTAFAFEHREIVGKLDVGQVAVIGGSRRPGLFRYVPNDALVSSPDGGRSWTVLDVPARVRERQVDVGATVLLAQGQDTDLLRSPLPTRIRAAPVAAAAVGSTTVGKKVRCVAARFAGATASTTAVGLPAGGLLAGVGGYTIPRLGSPRVACHTVARTPAGLAFASSAPVKSAPISSAAAARATADRLRGAAYRALSRVFGPGSTLTPCTGTTIITTTTRSTTTIAASPSTSRP